MIEYDEETALCQYVWRYGRRFITDLELRADRAATVREKAARAAEMGSKQLAKVLLKQWGCVGDLEIDAALAEGYQALHLRVLRRIQCDPGALAGINRCPRCRRVVRTPTAKQCLWCNHDWHDFSA
jgi:hypothetical protein